MFWIKTAQAALMFAILMTLVYIQQEVYQKPINPYFMGMVTVGVPYLLTLLVVKVLDWRIGRRARLAEFRGHQQPDQRLGIERRTGDRWET
jgi:ABC-type uncharacterized transport system permease subunit